MQAIAHISFTVILGEYHLWQGLGGNWLVSHEPTKQLAYYASVDDIITDWFLTKDKDLARLLNRLWIEHKESLS